MDMDMDAKDIPPVDLENIDLSDVGVAKLVAKRAENRLLLVQEGPGRKAWYLWNGSRWSPQDSDAPIYMFINSLGKVLLQFSRSDASIFKGKDGDKNRKEYQRWSRSLQSHTRTSAIVQAAQRYVEGVRLEHFDTDPRALAFTDGVARLTDEPPFYEFRPWSEIPAAERTFLKNTGVEWPGIDYRNEEWEDTLKKFQPDRKMRRFILKVWGYSLMGGNPLGLLVVHIGETMTGKTTNLNIVNSSLGDYGGGINATAFRGKFDDGPREDLAGVMRKRFAIAGEFSEAWELHSDQIKRLTGDELIPFRAIYGHQQAAHPEFTPHISCNAPPTVKGADLALRARLLGIPWDSPVPERSEDGRRLREDPAVRRAVLAGLMRGWVAYKKEGLGRETWPEKVDLRVAEIFERMSLVTTFVAEYCDTCPEDEPRSSYADQDPDLWGAFAAWQDLAEVNRRDRLNKGHFLAQLRDLGYKSGTSRRVRGEERGKVLRARLGLRLNERGESLGGGRVRMSREA